MTRAREAEDASDASMNGAGGAGFEDGERRVAKTSETVALNLVRDIMARGLKTGDRLPLEAAMLQEYRVSRASLREALRLLEVQGLISLKPGPGGGPVVGRVDARHLARTIIAGHATKAARLTAAHFRAQHDYYRERWPARFEELIEWR